MRKSIFTAEEIATGIAALGKREGAEFMRERLILEIVSTTGPDINGCALSFREGRRTMAADILNLLDLPLDNDRPDGSRTTGLNLSRKQSGTSRRVPIDPPGGYGRGPRPVGGSRRKPSGVGA